MVVVAVTVAVVMRVVVLRLVLWLRVVVVVMIVVVVGGRGSYIDSVSVSGLLHFGLDLVARFGVELLDDLRQLLAVAQRAGLLFAQLLRLDAPAPAAAPA